MILVYGIHKNKNEESRIFLDETDLSIPFGNEINEQPLLLLKKIETSIINNEVVSHLFKHDNVSLWWFIHPTIFPPFRTAVVFIEKFEEMISKNKPSLIKVVGEFDKLHLIRQICQKMKIPLQYSKTKYFGFMAKEWLKIKTQRYRFSKITNKKFNKRLAVFQSKKSEIPTLDGKVVFAVSTYYRRYVYDIEKGTSVKGEYLQRHIMDMVEKMNYEIIGVDLDYSFQGEVESLKERLEGDIQWFPVEAIPHKYSAKNNYSEFLTQYLSIINSDNFQSLFEFHDINFWESVKNEFIKLSYLPHLPTYLKLIDSFQRLFNTNKPRAIFLPYETGPLALSIIVAAKKCGITTVGIQHGDLGQKNSDYTHNEVQSSTNPWGMLLPDYTLLFGNYTLRVLTEEWIYPKEKFIVFGHPEFFNIDEVKKSLHSQDLRKKYGLPPDRKVILFTSSKLQKYYKFFGSRDYDERVFKKLLDSYAKNNQYYVIFKPHPVRGEYVEFYKKLISDCKCDNFVITQGDLFELLHISDVVISIYSSTIIDSVVFGKMTIRVSFPGSVYSDTIDEDNILVSCDLDSLPSHIERLIFNKNARQELNKNRERFVKDQYNIPNDDAYNQLRAIIPKQD